MDLPKILLTGLFFLFFLVFFEFLDNWAWEGKKTSRKKKTKKKLHGLTQDSSHRIDFFVFLVFPEFLDIWKAENGKKGEKQNVQKPNAPSVGF